MPPTAGLLLYRFARFGAATSVMARASVTTSQHDADFPMDAARRLEQFAAALLHRDLSDSCAALQGAIEARMEASPPPAPEAVAQVPTLLAALHAARDDATREVLLAVGHAAALWIWLADDEVERRKGTAGPSHPDLARFEELAELAGGTRRDERPGSSSSRDG